MRSAVVVRPIRVAIDVRMPPNQWGGVQQLVEGLARGLSGLEGTDEYLFLGYADAASWLDPALGGSAHRLEVPPAWGRTARRRLYDSVTSRARRLGRILAQAATPIVRPRPPAIPRSDGRLEALGVDVIHFVTPQAYRTEVPSLYQPHDLLHVHEPQQFSSLHRDYREHAYREFCEQAALVVAMTNWGRSDLAAHYGIDPGRIAVVPLPPVVVPPIAGIHQDVRPTDGYLLYPAQTWPHKNHLGLIGALKLVRDRHPDMRIVCTGRLTEHYGQIAKRAASLGVDDRIRFLGYVPETELRELYRGALGVVFPSRFEGWGLPVVEAFAAGTPVGCSDIPVLREVAGNAALYFDPRSAQSIANGMARLWTDATLRGTLRTAGLERVKGLTWPKAAATFRALYRQIARAGLTEEDEVLLEPPTLVHG
jgi:glycosyltransferase involved in cell wall biosynthesis